MILGRTGISPHGSFPPDLPLPPPPVWRPHHQRSSESLRLKVRWSSSDDGRPSPVNPEAIDLLQTTVVQPPDPGSGTKRLPPEVVYAVRDPGTSGGAAPTGSGRRRPPRMRIVLLPEDDECSETISVSGGGEGDDDRELFRRRSSAHGSLPDANDPERIPADHVIVGRRHVHRKSPSAGLSVSPIRRLRSSFRCCRCCLRSDPEGSGPEGRILHPPSGLRGGFGGGGGGGGESPFRSSEFLRDADSMGRLRIRRRRRRRVGDVRRFSAPVIFLFVFVGIALAAVGVAVGFVLINTNLIQSRISKSHFTNISKQCFIQAC